MDYRKIKGPFFSGDAEFYQQVVHWFDDAKFVEIGCFRGRSSVCMAQLIRDSGKNIKLWCVDAWALPTRRVHGEFMKNIEQFGDIITPIRALSVDAAKQFGDHSLDFVFIDASHDYDSVVADIEAWRSKVKPGGILAGHDYIGQPGVVRAVDEIFGDDVCIYEVEGRRSPCDVACWYWTVPGV